MPNITDHGLIAGQVHEQVKQQLERERLERANSAGAAVTTEGVEAHYQRDVTPRTSLVAYAKKLWAGPWFGGVSVNTRFLKLFK